MHLGKLRGTESWGMGFLSALQSLSLRLSHLDCTTYHSFPPLVSLSVKGWSSALLPQVWRGGLAAQGKGQQTQASPIQARQEDSQLSLAPGAVLVSLNGQFLSCNVLVYFKSPLL